MFCVPSSSCFRRNEVTHMENSYSDKNIFYCSERVDLPILKMRTPNNESLRFPYTKSCILSFLIKSVMLELIKIVSLLTCVVVINAFVPQRQVRMRRTTSINLSTSDGDILNRRSAVVTVATLSLGLTPFPAHGSSPKAEEFIRIGMQAPPQGGETDFKELPNGVKVKDYRIGSGDYVVKEDSQVAIQATGRLLNFNGFIFYSTKNNNPDGFGALPLIVNLGRGEALPGLEAGMIGMKKGGIRRILIPADLAYSNYHDLEPRPMSANDQRALDSVVKNPNMDATVLFDVLLERFK